MTTRDDARRSAAHDPSGWAAARIRAGRRRSRRRPASSTGLSLPEKLYAARERKGVDLYRAERDTKIRARYLAALEQGEYGELQGDVYTKGFLRNYATVPRARPRGGHRPVAPRARRRAGPEDRPHRPQADRPAPAGPPVLARRRRRRAPDDPDRRASASGSGSRSCGSRSRRRSRSPRRVRRRSSSTEDATSYTLAGTSIPGATITVELAGGTRQTSADSTGAWTMPVDVRRGRNEFKVDATDPDTGKHAEDPMTIVITVPVQRDRGAVADGRPAGRGHDLRERGDPGLGHGVEREPGHGHRDVRRTGRRRPRARRQAPAASPPRRPAPAAITIPVGDDGKWDTERQPAPADDRPLVDHVDGLERAGQVGGPDPPRRGRLQGRQPRRRDQGRAGLDQGLGRRQDRLVRRPGRPDLPVAAPS